MSTDTSAHVPLTAAEVADVTLMVADYKNLLDTLTKFHDEDLFNYYVVRQNLYHMGYDFNTKTVRPGYKLPKKTIRRTLRVLGRFKRALKEHEIEGQIITEGLKRWQLSLLEYAEAENGGE